MGLNPRAGLWYSIGVFGAKSRMRLIMKPDQKSYGVVPPTPSLFEPIIRLWLGLLNAIVWCLTLSTGRVVRRRRDNRRYQMPPIY